jgi:hypothetical protein
MTWASRNIVSFALCFQFLLSFNSFVAFKWYINETLLRSEVRGAVSKLISGGFDWRSSLYSFIALVPKDPHYRSHFRPHFAESSQLTFLRLLNKWRVCKEGQAGNNKKTTPRLDCAFWTTWPSFGRQRSGCFRTSLGCKPKSQYGFLWADSGIQKKCEEGQSNYGLISSKRSKAPHGACWSPWGTKSASNDAPN